MSAWWSKRVRLTACRWRGFATATAVLAFGAMGTLAWGAEGDDTPLAASPNLALEGATILPISPHRPTRKPRNVHNAGCQASTFRIAIDVGHTPEAPGATSARGVKEYSFNLQLARRIERALNDGGFSSTVLINVHGIGRDQLVKRTKRANALGADLLLSVHHDDMQSTYHATWTYDGTPHAYSDKFSGYSLFVSRDNPYFDNSFAFAKRLGAELMARGMKFSPHHAESIPGEGREIIDADAGIYRYDHLVVLRSSGAPAVLLEAGIIVNRAEELVLASPEGRGRISAAVEAAISAYCMTLGGVK
jgi:N-acetylmuramoyl-L-alanine amidase